MLYIIFYISASYENNSAQTIGKALDLTDAHNPHPAYFVIMCVTACSNPSIVSSNMGKISRMALMVRV